MTKLGYKTKVGEEDLYLAIEVSSATAGCCLIAAVLMYVLWILLRELRGCMCKKEDPMEKAFNLMGRFKGKRVSSNRWASRRLPSFSGSSRRAPRPPPRMTSFLGERASTSSGSEEDQESTASQETQMLNPGLTPTLQVQGFYQAFPQLVQNSDQAPPPLVLVPDQDRGRTEAPAQIHERNLYSVPTPPPAPGLSARPAPPVQCSPAGSSGAVPRRPVLGPSFSDQIKEAQHKMLTRSRSMKK